MRLWRGVSAAASPGGAASGGEAPKRFPEMRATLRITPIGTVLVMAAGGLLLSGCSPSTTGQASSVAQRNHSSEIVMSRDIAARFPGANVLSEAEFASVIVGRVFRYRDIGGELVVERPKEVFAEGGQYRIHWLRSISYGTWSIAGGIVEIDCTGCRYTFLNVGWKRIFFRHESRLLMATANGEGSVVELISEP